jgi:hypothetical protein
MATGSPGGHDDTSHAPDSKGRPSSTHLFVPPATETAS